jgi:hypothetical protein
MKTISGSERTMDHPVVGEEGQLSPPRHLFPVLERLFADATLFAIFTVRFVKNVFQPPYEVNEFLKQSYLIGNRSLSLVAITGFIIGLCSPYSRGQPWHSLAPRRGCPLWLLCRSCERSGRNKRLDLLFTS